MKGVGLNWVEVDVDAIHHNVREVKSLLSSRTKLMGVVKANAYGHGAVETARIILESGADYLGVNSVEEGIELRKGGIKAPILVFNPPLPEETRRILRGDLTISLANLKLAEQMSRIAWREGGEIKAHLKIETGFGHGGILPEEVVTFVRKIDGMGNFELEGIYTHFATAYQRDKTYTHQQFKYFMKAVESLEEAGIRIPLKHVANSAATLDLPKTHLDMVRVGTLIYGQYPSNEVEQKLDLHDTWKLKSTIVFIREFHSSGTIGYGREYKVKPGTVIATLPIGFAEGFTVIPESIASRSQYMIKALLEKVGVLRKAEVQIKGDYAPIVGRVSMQHTTIDVTHLFNVMPGDVAVLPARRTAISDRVPRVYVKDGRPYKAVTVTGEKKFKEVGGYEAKRDL